MDWEGITLATVGFGLYCFALILRSTGLRHLRFARIIDLAAPDSSIGLSPGRTWIQAASLLSSMVLMGVALWHSIDTDRGTFWLLCYLGAMLIAIRLVGFFFTHVSLVVLEIETDPASKLSLAHLCHSPFILGGLTLLIVVAGVPATLDRILGARFDVYLETQRRELEVTARKEGFNERSYRPRSLWIGGRAQYETEFFAHVLIPGRRILIEGRAGIGKTWFLMQTRYDSRRRHPDRAVIFLRARDLDYENNEHWLDHIGRAAFGGLPRGAHPVIQRRLARALILIDGLDEVHSANRHDATLEVIRFGNVPSLEDNIVVVTTRPTELVVTTRPTDIVTNESLTDLQLLTAKEGGRFELAELPVLIARETGKELESTSARITRLTAKLRTQVSSLHPVDERVLSVFYSRPVPNFPAMTPQETASLYEAFIRSFGLRDQPRGAAGESLPIPFLSTYRDLDIAEELFLKAVSGDIRVPPGTPAEMHAQMRTQLIGEFLSRRIELNYHAAARDSAFAQRVMRELTDHCASYLRDSPNATTFRFEPRSFQHSFDGTTFDKVMLESEVLVQEREGGRLVFDNPALDEYFRNRVRELGSDQWPGGSP